jgi:phytoene desaturase
MDPLSSSSPAAVVIGSGVGGLAVAIRLAVKGYRVTVYERNNEPGGKMNLFEKDGYFFDAGPSLFTQPKNLEELFAIAGEPMEDYFQYRSLPLACRYFWSNGKIVNAYTAPDAFAKELEEKLGEDPTSVKAYLLRAEKAYNSIGSVFLDHSLHLARTWLNKRLLPAIASTRLSYLTSSMHAFNRSSFRSEEAVQLFDRFATYNGSDPYKAPAMLTMIPHLEQNEGTFYPVGGMISIPRALYKLALKKGVKFIFNTRVDRIVHEHGQAKAVVVNDQLVTADMVVSNMDVYYVYRDLLKDAKAAARVLTRERSSSAMIFYWGIRKEFSQFHLHNILFSNNYKEEFNHIFNLGKLFDDPTVYINITSKMEDGFCPPGHENWFVMVNAPANRGQNWESLREQVKSSLHYKISRILGEDIAPLIATEIVMDPKGIEQNTLSHGGSLYGTSSNSIFAAFLRQSNFSSSIKGLYFTGGSVHPGGGIPLCLKSAKIVSELA